MIRPRPEAEPSSAGSFKPAVGVESFRPFLDSDFLALPMVFAEFGVGGVGVVAVVGVGVERDVEENLLPVWCEAVSALPRKRMRNRCLW